MKSLARKLFIPTLAAALVACVAGLAFAATGGRLPAPASQAIPAFLGFGGDDKPAAPQAAPPMGPMFPGRGSSGTFCRLWKGPR